MEQVIARNYATNRNTERRFFTGMALTVALVVFVGFAPSYYLKPLFGVEPTSGRLTAMHHIHGLIFTLWLVFLVAQTVLVKRGRTDIHRRLGMAGMTLAMLMLALAFYLQLDNLKQGITIPGVPPPAFFGVAVADLVVFAVLLGAGFFYRRRPDVHKRLMMFYHFDSDASDGAVCVAGVDVHSDSGTVPRLAHAGLADCRVRRV